RRRRADVHGPRGEKHVAQPGFDASEHALEVLPAMADDRPRHRQEDFGANLGGSGDEEGSEGGVGHGGKLSDGGRERGSVPGLSSRAQRGICSSGAKNRSLTALVMTPSGRLSTASPPGPPTRP